MHKMGYIHTMEYYSAAIKNFLTFFLKKISFIFREKEREGEREGEKHLSVASHTPPTVDLACNPGMCPDW